MDTGRPLRIALVSAYFRPHVGGIERFTELLAGALVKRGHDVTVLSCRTDRASPLDERIDGYRVSRIPATNRLERHLRVPYPVPWLPGLRKVAALVDRCDVVHAHEGRYLTSWAALYAAAASRVPSVLTQHVGFEPQSGPSLNLIQRVSIRASRRFVRKASVVTTINSEVASWVQREWQAADVRVLPVGVHGERVEGYRSEFGLPDDRFLVLFVGRDVPKKNLGAVVEALDPAFDVVAVTDAQPSRHPQLHVLPFMPPDRLARLRGCVDAYVLPSSGGEGLPLTLQEAMAAGLPVVTTMLAGFEQSIDADDVLVVEPTGASIRSALRRLASDPVLRRRLASRSRKAAERQFGVDAFVDAYESLYASLVFGDG